MNTQSKVFKGNGKKIVTWNASSYFQASIIGVRDGMSCTVDSARFETRSEADAFAMSETGTDREVSRHGWATEDQIESVQAD